VARSSAETTNSERGAFEERFADVCAPRPSYKLCSRTGWSHFNVLKDSHPGKADLG
jgi:hypothetical protein